MSGFLEQILSSGNRCDPERYGRDMARVLQIPRYDPFKEAPDCTSVLAKSWVADPLWTVQSACLYALARAGGLLAIVPVGEGKTRVVLLAATVLDKARPLILVPAKLRSQMYAEWSRMSTHWHIVAPTIWSYSYLSAKSETDRLAELAPDIIIADEAHKLRDRGRARWRRVKRYLEAHKVPLIVLSGTLEGRSLHDYAHLAWYALGEGTPLPRDGRKLAQWANVIDARGEYQKRDLVAMEPLRAAFGVETKGRRGIREAYGRRLASTPGVVVHVTEGIPAAINVFRWTSLPTPNPTATALKTLKEDWERPDGEILVDAQQRWACSRQLSMGFYYRRAWPGGVVDEVWLDARKQWRSAVRSELRLNAKAGYDSEGLVEDAVKAGWGNRVLQDAYRAWARVKHRPEPPQETVWLSDYVFQALKRVLDRDKRPTLVWYSYSTAMEERLARLLPVHGQGSEEPERGRSAACSIEVHGEGRNYPEWAANIILELPQSGDGCEQLFGRTHRNGQTADEVEFLIYQHTDALRNAWNVAMLEQRARAERSNVRGKLLRATVVEV